MSGVSSAQTYGYTDLHSAGFENSEALDINNLGQVVGSAHSFPTLRAQAAVVWNGATPTYLNALAGRPFAVATSINDGGQIAGSSYGMSFRYQNNPVIWNGVTPTLLQTTVADPVNAAGADSINNNGQVVGSTYDAFGSRAVLWTSTTNSVDLSRSNGHYQGGANDINDLGQSVGYAYDGSGGPTQAILWNGTVATVLGPGAANGINNRGQIVGRSGGYPTLWSGGVAATLGTLIGAATDINEIGQIVGYVSVNGHGRATLWSSGAATDLNSFLDAATVSAGWLLTDANAINDSGWIAGTATNTITNVTHAYVLSVVPEPSSWALILVGLGIVGSRRRSSAGAKGRVF